MVRFGYLQFAVLGQESQWAAEASECAREQQGFWPYHDELYASQQGKNEGRFQQSEPEVNGGEAGT